MIHYTSYRRRQTRFVQCLLGLSHVPQLQVQGYPMYHSHTLRVDHVKATTGPAPPGKARHGTPCLRLQPHPPNLPNLCSHSRPAFPQGTPSQQHMLLTMPYSHAMYCSRCVFIDAYACMHLGSLAEAVLGRIPSRAQRPTDGVCLRGVGRRWRRIQT